jgi:glycosyltransferase involved in cell wall biosynthesis
VRDLKISLITVTFNSENTISRCIQSVASQSYKNIEYIVIDGGSTDNTIRIANSYSNVISIFISEPDQGIYDAMNKGVKHAHGDIIGILNSDDFFADKNALAAVAAAFTLQGTDIVYGDIDYVNPKGKVIRKWRSGEYKHDIFNRGWMPPHPAFYCKRALFEELGFYSLEYGTAADYELMLRFMHLNKVSAWHLKKILVKMEIGGVSNKSYKNRVKSLLNDFKAMRNNGILMPAITLILKPLRKISQYF